MYIETLIYIGYTRWVYTLDNITYTLGNMSQCTTMYIPNVYSCRQMYIVDLIYVGYIRWVYTLDNISYTLGNIIHDVYNVLQCIYPMYMQITRTVKCIYPMYIHVVQCI